MQDDVVKHTMGQELRPGDAVVLTMEATRDILGARRETTSDHPIVGIVLKKLETFNGEAIWGVLVDDGLLEQIMDSEISHTLRAE
jgi:hypothetical protein